MELGLRLQLEFNSSGAPRAVSSLVGMKKSEYLILELPDEFDQYNRPDYLEVGNSIVIRYINNNGVVYGVKSQITKTIYTPVKLLIVDYPKVIENHKLRKTKRSSCLLHSYIDVDNLLIEGHVLNINVGGCRASIDVNKVEKSHLESSKNISLSMQIPGVEGVVSVEGQIRNVTKESSKYLVGIQFERLESKAELKINDFLKSLEKAETIDDDFLESTVSEV